MPTLDARLSPAEQDHLIASLRNADRLARSLDTRALRQAWASPWSHLRHAALSSPACPADVLDDALALLDQPHLSGFDTRLLATLAGRDDLPACAWPALATHPVPDIAWACAGNPAAPGDALAALAARRDGTWAGHADLLANPATPYPVLLAVLDLPRERYDTAQVIERAAPALARHDLDPGARAQVAARILARCAPAPGTPVTSPTGSMLRRLCEHALRLRAMPADALTHLWSAVAAWADLDRWDERHWPVHLAVDLVRHPAAPPDLLADAALRPSALVRAQAAASPACPVEARVCEALLR